MTENKIKKIHRNTNDIEDVMMPRRAWNQRYYRFLDYVCQVVDKSTVAIADSFAPNDFEVFISSCN